jgi:hypothetical protein
VYLPERYDYRNYEGETLDMVQTFIEEEYLWFPFPTHDDMLDCLARITDPDMHVSFPGDFDPQASSRYTAAGIQYERQEANSGEQYDALRFGL